MQLGSCRSECYMKDTIEYYDENADMLFERYNSAQMAESYALFTAYLKPGSSIVDLGCGSGRDMKYFSSLGYSVSGVDASSSLAALAREYSGCDVECTDFLSWNPECQYDAFWANASLLHLDERELLEFFRTKLRFLRPGGIFYCSLKKGIETGVDEDGRFFQNYTDGLLRKILKEARELEVLEKREAKDGLGREIVWIQIAFSRKKL